MDTDSGYAAISQRLTKALRLPQPPVAICFASNAPEGAEHPASPVPAGCRFWQDGATKVIATNAVDHASCAIGVYTHHLASSQRQQQDLADALGVFRDLGYVRDEDLPLIPVLDANPAYVVYSPLSKTPTSPDVVILLANANQVLILTEAAQQVEGRETLAMGRPACAVVPQVKNSGRAALSLGCCGARRYLDVLDDSTAIFAIPGGKLESYTQRIEALAHANSTLSNFHDVRRRQFERGGTPTVRESLEALQAGQ